MDTDIGILRQLPPPVNGPINDVIINDRDVYVVLINSADELKVEYEDMDIGELKAGTREFFTNPEDSKNLPKRRKITRAEVTERISYYNGLLASEPDAPAYKKGLRKWEKRLNAINLIGEYYELPGSAVISLQNDTETSYDMYIQVQNELTRAINELRDELSDEKFGKPYKELNKDDAEEKKMILAIRQVFPQRISEAEPNVTKKK
jgi:hypothetical protein